MLRAGRSPAAISPEKLRLARWLKAMAARRPVCAPPQPWLDTTRAWMAALRPVWGPGRFESADSRSAQNAPSILRSRVLRRIDYERSAVFTISGAFAKCCRDDGAPFLLLFSGEFHRRPGRDGESGLSCRRDFAKVCGPVDFRRRRTKRNLPPRACSARVAADAAFKANPWRQSLASAQCGAKAPQCDRWQRPLCQPSSPAGSQANALSAGLSRLRLPLFSAFHDRR